MSAKPLRLGLPDDVRRGLKAARLEKGWSQAELGRRAGLPQAHVSGIETGRIVPRFDTMLELIRLLDHDLMLVHRRLVATVTYFVRDHNRRTLGDPGEEQRPLYALDGEEEEEGEDDDHQEGEDA